MFAARHAARIVALALVCSGLWVSLTAVRMGERPDSPAPTGNARAAPVPTRAGSGAASADGAARPVDVHALPWPAQGQAALAVSGSGALAPDRDPAAVPIASVAKMMTAYLVLRAHPLDGPGFTVTIPAGDVADERRRAANDESVVPVAVGEVLGERQMLEGLLLPSGNNIAILLAVRESGSVAEFVALMNDAAHALGMRHTRYTDPSGLDAATTSTAADQLILLKAAMGNPDFAALVRMRTAQLPVAGTVHNTNPLLGRAGFVGAKTGSDDAAGGCLAFVAVRTVDGRTVTVFGVVLGQRGPRLIDAAAQAARRLVDAAIVRA
jgi:D-alanyl-D-alanine carboxypeptidase (penicillin-binding protein 5/6)